MEIGTNDFRISDLGDDGSTAFAADKPATVHNSADNEYLVAFTGDDNTGTLVQDEEEIFIQRLVTNLCGDGIIDPAEECDDGNTDDGDGCSSACLTEGDVTNGGDTDGGCSLIR